MTEPPTAIAFSPPLACSAIVAVGQICGKPAITGTLYPLPSRQYILQPFCRDCVGVLAAMYLTEGHASEERRGEWEP